MTDCTNQALPELLQQHAGHDPERVLLTPETVAHCLDLQPKTLEAWRRAGQELPFVKLGRRVKYRLSDVLGFIDRNTFHTSREAMSREHAAGG